MRSCSLTTFIVSAIIKGYILCHECPRIAIAFTPKPRISKRPGSLELSSTALGLRIAYQGEPGAYSEKATRELLGDKVVAIGRPDFESCFQAVVQMECDYACLPIENSLGGSIHENYDLMMRYELTICAEHEFRVSHCLLAAHGVELDQIKYAISHPQALKQCDNYLRSLGITPIPTYDTAGSAKMISEDDLPSRCTPQNTCAIASDLAALTYGLNCLAESIEDDNTNFTRFLLLGRKGIVEYLSKGIPAKTSLVYTLRNAAGALQKTLSCFSLRDIDCSKIESRPTSASLLNYLTYLYQQNGQAEAREKETSPRFSYSFYLDILDGQLDPNTENALNHLRELADYVRILGSYPQKSRLVGPIEEAVDAMQAQTVNPNDVSTNTLPSENGDEQPLRIGIVGFGHFGQFLAEQMSSKHIVTCMDTVDKTTEARTMGLEFHPHFDSSAFFKDLDIIVLSVPLIDFQDVVESLPIDQLSGKLVVEVCPLNNHPRNIMLNAFAKVPDIDILCTNPMFGPLPSTTTTSSGGGSNSSSKSATSSASLLDGRPMVFDKVRISDMRRCERYLKIFEKSRCRVVPMNSEQHDSTIADAEFVTHLVGRLLDPKLLPPTPVMSKEYRALSEVADMTSGDSFDMFFGMYKYSEREKAKEYIATLRENLAAVERQLAAKEAYLVAKSEMMRSDRQRLLAETRLLLQELIRSGVSLDSIGTQDSIITEKHNDNTPIQEGVTNKDV